jgi:membrane-bound serine protease (ClpP class)
VAAACDDKKETNFEKMIWYSMLQRLSMLCLIILAAIMPASAALRSEDSKPDSKKAVRATPPVDGAIYVIPLRGAISKAGFSFLRRAVKEAAANGAAAVILDMDTPGGELGAAVKIVDALNRSGLETITWVHPNAGSAGAMIAVGTRYIFMSPYSAIGAAAPVMSGGQNLGETMEKKVVSYYSGYFRSVAEKNEHNPQIAEAFINDDVRLVVNGKVLCEKGELLTLSAQEATQLVNGTPLFAMGIADSAEEIRKQMGYNGEIVRIEPLGFERLAYYITVLAPIFLLGGIVGTYIEMKTPGFGVPGIIALLCFLIFFTGHFVAGLAGYEVFGVFFLGLILILVEIFILPGTMVSGLLGTALVIGSLVFAMIDRYPEEGIFPSPEMLIRPLLNLAIAMGGAVIAGVVLAHFLPRTALYHHLVLGTSLAAGPALDRSRQNVSTNAALPFQEGAEGIARSPLHPSGTAEFSDELVDVVSDGDFVAIGSRVRVVKIEGSRIVVTSVA